MAPADAATFKGLLLSLASALGGEKFELDKAKARLYWEALKHVPIEALQAAVPGLLQSCTYFPRPKEWLAECDRLATPARPALPPARVTDEGKREWIIECPTCEDTGWAFVTLGGEPIPVAAMLKQQTQAHADGKAYTRLVRRCTCVPNNQTYRRTHPLETRYGRDEA